MRSLSVVAVVLFNVKTIDQAVLFTVFSHAFAIRKKIAGGDSRGRYATSGVLAGLVADIALVSAGTLTAVSAGILIASSIYIACDDL